MRLMSTTQVDRLDTPTSRVAPHVSRYASGSLIASHTHDTLQVLYARSGTLQVRVRQHVCVVDPGRAALIPPGMEHAIRVREDTEMASLYCSNAALPDEFRSVAVSPMTQELILRTVERSSEHAFRADRHVHLLGLLFEELRTPALTIPRIHLPNDRRAARVCEEVLKSPADHPHLERLAERAGASPRTINRLLRRELGLSFRQWRQQVMMNMAIDALLQGASVSNVAIELGYTSVSAFSYAFRCWTGVSPTAYGKPQNNHVTQ